MPREVKSLVYTFDELDDAAKEKARDWFRSCRDSSDFDFVIDDAVRMGNILGIEFDVRPVKLMNGATRYDPKIWWNLGYSQGDFASFEGTYRYGQGATKKIREEAPQDKELHRIADALLEAQKPYFYKLIAHCWVRRDNMQVDVEYGQDVHRALIGGDDSAREIESALEAFASWIYARLREEDEYQTSDEQVDESILANGYEFDDEGDIQ